MTKAPSRRAFSRRAPARNVLNDIVMFFASAFIGLGYLIALPFVMAWMLWPVMLDTVRRYNAARRAGKL